MDNLPHFGLCLVVCVVLLSGISLAEVISSYQVPVDTEKCPEVSISDFESPSATILLLVHTATGIHKESHFFRHVKESFGVQVETFLTDSIFAFPSNLSVYEFLSQSSDIAWIRKFPPKAKLDHSFVYGISSLEEPPLPALIAHFVQAEANPLLRLSGFSDLIYSVEFYNQKRIHMDAPDEQKVRALARRLSKSPYFIFVERKLRYVPQLKWAKPLVFNGITDVDMVEKIYDSGKGMITFDSSILSGDQEVISLVDSGIKKSTFMYGDLTKNSRTVVKWNGSYVPTKEDYESFSEWPDSRIKYYVGSNHQIADDELLHGTYIASILNGKQLQELSAFDGIATRATLSVFDLSTTTAFTIPPNFEGVMEWGYLSGARIQCHSWSGFRDFIQDIDASQFNYIVHEVDAYQWKRQDFLIVAAAGISNTSPCFFPNDDCKIGDKCAIAYKSIGIFGQSKNAVVVGSSFNSKHATELHRVRSCSSDFTDDFEFLGEDVFTISGTSPTEGAKIRKPDIYAPGEYVFTHTFQSGCSGEFGSSGCLGVKVEGSSVSTAIVSGCLAIIRQYLREGMYSNGFSNSSIGFSKISSALMKATLMHGAVQSPTGQRKFASLFCDSVWNCQSFNRTILESELITGFGNVKLSSVLKIGRQPGYTLAFPGHSEEESSNHSIHGDPILKEADKPVIFKYCAFPSNSTGKVTLVWTDPPSSTGSSSLENDLNLKLTFRSTVYRGNQHLFQNGNVNSFVDSVNTIEIVEFPAVSESEEKEDVLVEVSLAGTTIKGGLGYQPFALVLSGFLSEGDCTSTIKPTEPPPEQTDEILGLKTKDWLAIGIGVGVAVLLCCGCSIYSCYFVCWYHWKGKFAATSMKTNIKKSSPKDTLELQSLPPVRRESRSFRGSGLIRL